MFYKIEKSESVSDVFTDLVYVRYEPRSKAVLGCSESEKQGLWSARRGTYYHVIGWPSFGIEAQDVTLSEISESEYRELKKQLDREDAVGEAITEIREKLGDHDADIGDLTDAVLELAEIIGG